MGRSAAAATDERFALALTSISKRFGATVALDDVSFRLRPGTVHALVGENGAGKTTLMGIAFGLIAPDAGSIDIPGAAGPIASPVDAIAAGVGMVHQHFTNVPAMTVAENVALGGRGTFRETRAARAVVDIGNRTGLRLDPKARAESLSVGAQQRLEIVKALARDARILILDEPTAVLAPAEADELLAWLRAFANNGNAVVLITHKLREALAIADDVTVLRRGRVVTTAPTGEWTVETLAMALFGDDLSAADSQRLGETPGDVVARLVNADVADERRVTTIDGASIEIRSGEIVGIAAIEGAGQHELLRALAARTPLARGEAQLPPVVGFVPEDRHRDALILDFTLAENVALEDAGARRGRIRWDLERERTQRLTEAFDVRGGAPDRPARILSGGNQQKLVLARELAHGPRLLVAENPTRGLDVRATQAIHARLRAVASGGGAVVLYSSDLDEVLTLASRVVVIHAGRLRQCALDRDEVGRAMLGVA
jgi:simple sugar transport system ATP-binding protein